MYNNDNPSKVEYWLTNKRFVIMVVIMVLMWAVIIGFFYLKADEVTKDPCGVCANQMGEDVVCSIAGTNPISRTYFSNWSVTQNVGR